jgi:hypothetical protein
MALSMEEQRILAEIEREFERSEPVLAASLTRLSRPGPGRLLAAASARARSPVVLVVASLAAVFLLTVVPVVVYVLVTLHSAAPGRAAASQAGQAAAPVMSAPR